MQKKKGISLIVLVITIIVMIILAAAVILSLSSSGIINKSNTAREATEINNEKQLIQIASANAMKVNEDARLTVESLQTAMNENTIQDVAMVVNNGDNIVVKFHETNRYYEVDIKGNILGLLKVELDDKGGVLDGSGTAIDPFIIMSIDDLVYFAKNASTYRNKYVAVGTTLDFNSDLSYVDKNTTAYDEFLGGDGTTGLKEQLTEGLGFKPINCNSVIFDGRNNEIKNLNVEVDGYAGLFEQVGGVTTITNLNLQGNVISNTYDAGGFVGGVHGNLVIDNCLFNGKVKSAKKTAGGIAGLANDARVSIYKCFVKGEIISELSSAGGIVGVASHVATLTLDGCVNHAKVSDGGNGAGGCLGHNSGGKVNIKNSSNYGETTMLRGVSHDGSGGIVGRGDSIIENCYNAGILKSNYTVDGNYRGAGGIVGNGASTINNCFNYGLIPIDGKNQNIGGIIGIANNGTIETVKLKQCYFNSEDIAKGIGKSAITEEIAIVKTKIELQSEAFVNELNSNIQNGCPYQVKNEDGTTTTQTIDTTGWAKWVYNEGSYPTLDLKTKWNGTAWITEK